MNELTMGEWRVGVTFNPSGSDEVDVIKAKAAALIDYINDCPGESRCKAIAMTEIESAAMWAVKAVTKRNRGT